MSLSGHLLLASASSVAGSSQASLGLLVVLTAVITAWLLTLFAGIPLFIDWRKRRRGQEEDYTLIKDEVLGHSARDGLPAKPALSTRFEDLTKVVKEAAEQFTGKAGEVDKNTSDIAEIRRILRSHNHD